MYLWIDLFRDVSKAINWDGLVIVINILGMFRKY